MRITREDIFFYGFNIIFGIIFLLIIGSLIYKTIATEPAGMLSKGIMITKPMKLSYKGYFWKTWDGWIPVGVNSEGGLKKWYFTIEDNNKTIIDCIQSGKNVKLYYHDYILMPYKKGHSHQVYKCEYTK